MTIMEAASPQEQIAAMLRSCGEFAKENIVLGELKAFSMCAHGASDPPAGHDMMYPSAQTPHVRSDQVESATVTVRRAL